MTGVVPNVRLNNGTSIPQVGFGVFRVPDDETEPAVLAAIEAGYRSIDTASLYGNEDGVGRAVASCGLPREQLFVSTKLWNDDQGHDSTLRAFDASLHRLGLEYVDLYLIHWPKPSLDRYVETWHAFETLAADGRARAIGVSNFQIAHLQRLLTETQVVPAVNQVELHTRLQQEPLRRFHAEHGIVTEARPARQGEALQDPYGRRSRHGTPRAEVVLVAGAVGNVAILKSTTLSRIRRIALFDFALGDADMSVLAGRGRRAVGPDRRARQVVVEGLQRWAAAGSGTRNNSGWPRSVPRLGIPRTVASRTPARCRARDVTGPRSCCGTVTAMSHCTAAAAAAPVRRSRRSRRRRKAPTAHCRAQGRRRRRSPAAGR